VHADAPADLIGRCVDVTVLSLGSYSLSARLVENWVGPIDSVSPPLGAYSMAANIACSPSTNVVHPASVSAQEVSA